MEFFYMLLLLATGLTGLTPAQAPKAEAPPPAANARAIPPNRPKATTLVLPRNCTDEQFKAAMADRTDWTTIQYRGGKLSDAWMAAIARCPELESFEAWGETGNLTARGLALLAQCPKLTSVRTYLRDFNPLDNATLAAIVQACPELRSFRHGSWGNQDYLLDDTALVALGKARKLRVAQVQILGTDAAKGLAALAEGCPDLRQLEVNGTLPLSDAGVAALDGTRKLESLEWNQCILLTDAGLERLALKHPGLKTLTLTNAPNLTDTGMKAMGTLKRLTNLSLYHSGAISSEGVMALRGCPELRMLNLTFSSQLADGALENAVKYWPMLLNVALNGMNLTDAGLASLAEGGTLRSVSITNAAGFTDPGIARFAEKSPQLRGLYLFDNKTAGDLTLSALARCPELTTINLAKAEAVTDRGLSALIGHANLRQLRLDQAAKITRAGREDFVRKMPKVMLTTARAISPATGHLPASGVDAARTLSLPRDCDLDKLKQLMGDDTGWLAVHSQAVNMTDEWMDLLVKCRELTSFNNINANPAGLTADGMARFGEFPKLRTLKLCSAKTLTDEALAAIAKGCPELRDLQICDSDGGSPLTDLGLAALQHCPKLERLVVREVDPRAGDHALFSFANGGLNLRELSIETPAAFTAEGMATLEHHPRLTLLRLSVNKDFGDNALAALAKNQPRLRTVMLRNATAITDDGLKHLATLPALGSLILTDSPKIGDPGLVALGSARRLFYLRLPRARNIGDEGLTALASCPNLWGISLEAARNPTDAGVTKLAAIPALAELNLSSAGQLTDDALDALGACPKLRSLNIASASKVTPEAMERIKTRRNNLRLTPPRAPAQQHKPQPPVEVF